MRKEIESLEELNTLLGEKSFDMNFWRAKNGLEQLALEGVVGTVLS